MSYPAGILPNQAMCDTPVYLSSDFSTLVGGEFTGTGSPDLASYAGNIFVPNIPYSWKYS